MITFQHSMSSVSPPWTVVCLHRQEEDKLVGALGYPRFSLGTTYMAEPTDALSDAQEQPIQGPCSPGHFCTDLLATPTWHVTCVDQPSSYVLRSSL